MLSTIQQYLCGISACNFLRDVGLSGDKMSSKEDDHSEGKFGGKYDDDDDFDIGAKQTYSTPPPKIEITSIEIDPTGAVPISAPLELKIKFELDRCMIVGSLLMKCN